MFQKFSFSEVRDECIPDTWSLGCCPQVVDPWNETATSFQRPTTSITARRWPRQSFQDILFSEIKVDYVNSNWEKDIFFSNQCWVIQKSLQSSNGAYLTIWIPSPLRPKMFENEKIICWLLKFCLNNNFANFLNFLIFSQLLPLFSCLSTN